jgi:putative flippase GtrA
MTGKWSSAAPGGRHLLQHGLGFLFSGCLSFVIDAGVLKLLTAGVGIDPLLARIVSLFCAIVVGWLSHRRFTFRLTTRPSLAEFVRFAGVQSTVFVLNYAIFAAVLLLRTGTEPLVAQFISSGVAMFFSYFGIRFGAFRIGQRAQE